MTDPRYVRYFEPARRDLQELCPDIMTANITPEQLYTVIGLLRWAKIKDTWMVKFYDAYLGYYHNGE